MIKKLLQDDAISPVEVASFLILYMNISNIKVIAFDVDSTLIYGPEAKKFYSQYGQAMEIAFAREMKLTLDQSRECLNAYRAAYDGRGELAFTTFGLSPDVPYEAICSVDPAGQLPRMGKSIETLEKLKEKVKIIVITDGPVEQAQKLFIQTGIREDWFEEIICWQKGSLKPKDGSSRIYQEVLNRYELKPEELLMVGDTHSVDIAPAQHLGIQTLHIGDRPESVSDISFLISNQ